MEDILASIRRILNEDDTATTVAAEHPVAELPFHKPEEDGVLVLDDSMLVTPDATVSAPPPEIPGSRAEPSPQGDVISRQTLLAPETEAAAASSVGALLRTLTIERHTEVSRGGLTIEDLVREEIRPLLKAWLDANLPPLVERLVRAEIERVTGRAAL